MRFAITFKPVSSVTTTLNNTKTCIINNSLEDVQQWIYKCLELTDPQLAKWLHNEGIRIENTVVKPIVFSLPLIKNNNLTLKISTPDPRISFALMKSFITKEPLLKLTALNGATYVIDRVKPVEFRNTVRFIAISPILLKKFHEFIPPSEFTTRQKEVIEAVNSNLISKYEAIYRTPYKGKGIKYIEFEADQSHNWATLYKGHVFYGILCPFVIIGDEALIKVAYEVGLGAKNACGFGCIESIHLK
jgi:CRISPR-associated endoribonuclease Cas6